MKTPMRCNECGKQFAKLIRRDTYEVICPKCKSTDTEPA